MTLRIKKEIIFTAKKLVDIGFNLGAEGNLSIRKNKDIYITPSGIDAYNLNDKQICVLDQTGKLVQLFILIQLGRQFCHV